MSDEKGAVQVLIERAKNADVPDEALKYSQAALNAANAIYSREKVKELRLWVEGNSDQ